MNQKRLYMIPRHEYLVQTSMNDSKIDYHMYKQAKRHTPDLLKVKHTMRDFYCNLKSNSPIARSLQTKRIVPA